MTATDLQQECSWCFAVSEPMSGERGDGHVPGSRDVHPAGRRAPAGRSGHGTGGKPVNTAEVIGLEILARRHHPRRHGAGRCAGRLAHRVPHHQGRPAVAAQST